MLACLTTQPAFRHKSYAAEAIATSNHLSFWDGCHCQRDSDLEVVDAPQAMNPWGSPLPAADEKTKAVSMGVSGILSIRPLDHRSVDGVEEMPRHRQAGKSNVDA